MSSFYKLDQADIKFGDIVTARFTNSNRRLVFKGKVVGSTKNYWKVVSLESPYPNETAGRMFRIQKLWSRTFSTNNCISEILKG